jgi:hypothetical protein
MHNHDTPRFAEVILIISESYNIAFSVPLLQIWQKTLAPYSIEDIEAALDAHLSDTERGERKPMPATLIRHIMGSARNRAEHAAMVLQSATTQATANQNVCFGDPMINAAVHQCRGWVHAYFCLINADTAEGYLNEFIRAYERLTVFANPHPAYLPGRYDDGKCCVVIGNEATVDRVIDTGFNPREPASAISTNRALQTLQIEGNGTA